MGAQFSKQRCHYVTKVVFWQSDSRKNPVKIAEFQSHNVEQITMMSCLQNTAAFGPPLFRFCVLLLDGSKIEVNATKWTRETVCEYVDDETVATK